MDELPTRGGPAPGGVRPRVPQLRLAALWFGLYVLTGSFLSVVLPFLLVPEHPGPNDPALVDPGIKNTALAVLEGIGLLVALVVQPAAGTVSDRLWGRFGRRRPMIAGGIAVATVALVLTGRAATFWWLVALYCVIQVATNIAQGAYQGLLPDIVPEAERSHASGLLGVAILSGQVAGIVLAGALAPRVVVVPVAIVLAASAATTVLGVREAPRARPPRTQARVRPGAATAAWLREILAERDFCVVVGSRFLVFTGIACVQRFAANYLRDGYTQWRLFGVIDLGSAKAATAALFAIVILVGLVATYPAVRLSQRIGRRRVLVIASLLGALGTGAFNVAPDLGVVLIEAIPIGLGFGMLVSVDWALMADLAPAERAGTFLGFSNVASVAAQSIVPFAMGPVIDVLDRGGGTGGYHVLFVVAAVSQLAGAVALGRLRRERRAAGRPVPA